MNNLEIAKNYFTLFFAGNKEAAFELIDDDAVWTIKGSDTVPTVGIWEGKAKISDFFERFTHNFDPKEFNILEYFTSGDNVFVIGDFTHCVKPTGNFITSDWMIRFSIKNSKITSYRILEDSYALHLAFLKNK